MPEFGFKSGSFTAEQLIETLSEYPSEARVKFVSTDGSPIYLESVHGQVENAKVEFDEDVLKEVLVAGTHIVVLTFDN